MNPAGGWADERLINDLQTRMKLIEDRVKALEEEDLEGAPEEEASEQS